MRKSLILLLVFTGCGNLNLKDKLVSMPDSVRPYYKEYFEIVGSGKQMLGSIDFGSKDTESLQGLLSADIPAGQCLFYGTNYKVILDKDIWLNAAESERRMIVYHELSHCVFGTLDHVSDSNSYMFLVPPTNLTKSQLKQQVIYFTTHLTKEWLITF